MPFVVVQVAARPLATVEAYRWTPGLAFRVEGVEVLGGPVLVWPFESQSRADSQADRLLSGMIGARSVATLGEVEATVAEWSEANALLS